MPLCNDVSSRLSLYSPHHESAVISKNYIRQKSCRKFHLKLPAGFFYFVLSYTVIFLFACSAATSSTVFSLTTAAPLYPSQRGVT